METCNFRSFAGDADFLVGAYLFEDVGLTAYGGAAGLLTTPSNPGVAAGILAVESLPMPDWFVPRSSSLIPRVRPFCLLLCCIGSYRGCKPPLSPHR